MVDLNFKYLVVLVLTTWLIINVSHFVIWLIDQHRRIRHFKELKDQIIKFNKIEDERERFN